MTDDFVAGDDVDRTGLEAGIDEACRPGAPFQQFQRPAPQDQRLGAVGPLCRLVDDADGDAVACQLGRHGHADRARTGNEDKPACGCRVLCFCHDALLRWHGAAA
jgi:hypothetical protein